LFEKQWIRVTLKAFILKRQIFLGSYNMVLYTKPAEKKEINGAAF